MGVSISAIPALAFSRNSLPVTITSTDVVDTAGVAAVNHIAFSGATDDHESIQLVWTRGDITMTAIAGASSGFEFPTGDGSPGYVASLIPYFQRNFYIDQDFVVTSAGSELILTARAKGIDGNIIPDSSDHMALTVTTAGVNQALKPNFKHWLEIWLDGQKVYACSLALDPGAATTGKDLAEVLASEMELTGSDRPSLTATGWQACANTLKRYCVRYAQFYGDSPVVQRLYTSAIAYVNRGALDIGTAAINDLAGFIRPSGSDLLTLCLRQGSKQILVQPDQPEWLYWLNLTGADQNVALQVILGYDDGTASAPVILSPGAVPANTKYYVPVGFNALGIGGMIPHGHTAKYYQVRVIKSTGEALSAVYTYVFDQYREWARYFIYLNSLGGYQTLYTWGKAAGKTSRSKTDVTKDVTDPFAAGYGRSKESNIRLQDKVTVNTGYTLPRDIALLKDFLASPERYALVNGRLVPIGISSDTLELPVDGANLNAAQFEYYPLYDELAYTDDPAQTDATVNGGGPGEAASYDMLRDDNNNEDNNFYRDI